jgi:hypothetical protein
VQVTSTYGRGELPIAIEASARVRQSENHIKLGVSARVGVNGGLN